MPAMGGLGPSWFPPKPSPTPAPPPRPHVPLEGKDLKEVYHICTESGTGNCAELAATTAVQAVMDLKDKYPNMTVRIEYAPGHAWTGIDLDGPDGPKPPQYIDTWQGVTGQSSDKPAPVHTTPWFKPSDILGPPKPAPPPAK